MPLPSFWSPGHTAALQDLARKAGTAIRAIRAAPGVERKADGSPVTLADRESQNIILEGLREITPDIPVIAEEKDNPAGLADGNACWLVDPLDGTRDYIAPGRTEYAVNIGLLIDGSPCLGIVYAPELDELFYGEPGRVEWHSPRGTTVFTPDTTAVSVAPPRLLTSRHEVQRLPLQTWQAERKILSWQPCTGAYKFGLLAAGEAELYPRTGPTSEWDTAAGEAILRAVGGQTVTFDGQPLAYGKSGYRNGSFLACGPSFDVAQLDEFLGLITTRG